MPMALQASEEVIPLSVGFDNDYALDASFKGKDLKFLGTYTARTKIIYDKNKNTLRFTPRKKGVGSLIIKEGKAILKKYTVSVEETDLTRVALEMKSLLGEISGITIRIINKKVIVDGEVFVPRDMKRIYNVIKEYPRQSSSLVTLSASAQNKVAQFIEREIGNPNITVKAANEKFILRGTVSTKEEKDHAKVIAQLYAPSVVTDPAVAAGAVRDRNVKNVIIDLIKVQKTPAKEKKQKKLVQMVVHYVQLEKDYTDKFRFQWSPGMAKPTEFSFGSRIGSNIVGAVVNLFPKLNWAKQFGFARILHSSNVVVEDGESGNIESNTNIPVSTLGEGGAADMKQVKVGITMKLTPHIAGSRQDGVRLKIEQFKVDNFLGNTSAGPLTSTQSISTIVYVRSGLSAAIGGIVSHTNSKHLNREPSGRSADPIINLLSSKNFVRKKNQFVVFVTPIIRSSASSDVEQIKKRFRISGQ